MTLKEYIQSQILPCYDQFDGAHQRDHTINVIQRSLQIAVHYPQINPDMVLTAAAFHDVGLQDGRAEHHLSSGRIIRDDPQLPNWFSPDEIEQIAQAAEDHRASANRPPRSLLGRIVAEADRLIDPETAIRRCLQYGVAHYPQLSPEQHYERMKEHLHKKYGPDGYLQLLLPESPNAEPLTRLRDIMANERQLRHIFERLSSTIA